MEMQRHRFRQGRRRCRKINGRSHPLTKTGKLQTASQESRDSGIDPRKPWLMASRDNRHLALTPIVLLRAHGGKWMPVNRATCLPETKRLSDFCMDDRTLTQRPLGAAPAG